MMIQAMPARELDSLTRQLRRYAHSRLRDRDAAEDVVQETFVAALANGATFQGRSTLRTWLTAILHNKIADHLRGRISARALFESEGDRTEFLDADGKAAPRHGGEPVDACADPCRILDARQSLEAAARGLGKLPRRSARALVMADLEGFETEDVCSALGVTPNNLWVMLHRARKALRGEMTGQMA
jgi:RNA polymerase sigma-70 factor, ECF subfamily